MVSSSRQFFVGGNFKMNGTVDMIKNLVNQLNNAKLSGKTGALSITEHTDDRSTDFGLVCFAVY
jgi:triosephosphate isomerase